MTRIYLARHGRTALNAAGVLRGPLGYDFESLDELEGEICRRAAPVAGYVNVATHEIVNRDPNRPLPDQFIARLERQHREAMKPPPSDEPEQL